MVLFHDKWSHAECFGDCCCAITTSIIGVSTRPDLADGLIHQHMERCGSRKDEYEIQEEKLLE